MSSPAHSDIFFIYADSISSKLSDSDVMSIVVSSLNLAIFASMITVLLSQSFRQFYAERVRNVSDKGALTLWLWNTAQHQTIGYGFRLGHRAPSFLLRSSRSNPALIHSNRLSTCDTRTGPSIRLSVRSPSMKKRPK